MSEHEKIWKRIQHYIDRTAIPAETGLRYGMKLDETGCLMNVVGGESTSVLAGICLAFDFGRAKGYRAAKAEVKCKEAT